MSKPRYIDRLKQHPGVPIATVFTFFGAAAFYEHGISGMATGALMSSFVWIPVLWTARTQPVSGEEG